MNKHMEKNILKIQGLKVRYGENTVLDLPEEILIKEGDVVGVIGENGAGKSTLINAVLEETDYQGDIQRGFTRRDLGVQFQNNHYNEYMKVGELIYIVTGHKPGDPAIRGEAEEFELQSLMKKKIGVLSGGEKQRMTLFLVLHLKPSVLFLDELTTGLDYARRQKMLSLIRRYARGRTVLCVTHYFDELNEFANKLLILSRGRLVWFGAIEELKKMFPLRSLLKVPSRYKDQLEPFCRTEEAGSGKNKKGELLLPAAEEGDLLLTVSDEDSRRKIMDYVSVHSIPFEIREADLYAYYNIALYYHRRGERFAQISDR